MAILPCPMFAAIPLGQVLTVTPLYRALAVGHVTMITRLQMAKQSVIAQKKRGPKPTGKGLLLGVRLHSPLLAMIDRWIEKTEPGISRPEAIRRILLSALGDKRGR